MIFKEDLIKIEEFLKKRSVCDCDLELRDFITGDELIPIICKEGNMNLPINRLKSYFKKDFFILNKVHKLPEAIGSVPVECRKPGVIVTFRDCQRVWRVFQFRGTLVNQWCCEEYWKDILKGAIQADEEDLTVVSFDGNNVLKFKDKEYNSEIFSGKGRVILRKTLQDYQEGCTCHTEPSDNVINGTAFNKENTIYIIQYDFDLGGNEINIPRGCVLYFAGGSLNNGKIILNRTPIVGAMPLNEIGTATLDGTYHIGQLNVEDNNLKYFNGTVWVTLVSKTVLDNYITTIEGDISNINRDLSLLRTQLEVLETKVTDNNTTLKAAIEALKGQVIAVQNSINTINTQIGTINSTLSVHDSNIQDNTNTINTLNTSLSTLVSNYNKLKVEVDNLKNNMPEEVDLTEINNSISTLNTSVANLKTWKNSMDTWKVSVDQDITNIKNQLAGIGSGSGDLTDLTSRVSSLESDRIKGLIVNGSNGVSVTGARDTNRNMVLNGIALSTDIQNLQRQINAIELPESSSLLPTVDISELDTKWSDMESMLNTMGGAEPTLYNVTSTVSGTTAVEGMLILISTTQKHTLTQVMITHRQIVDGAFDGSHKDDTVWIYYRSYNYRADGLTNEANTWTEWKMLNHEYISDTLGRIASLNTRVDRLEMYHNSPSTGDSDTTLPSINYDEIDTKWTKNPGLIANTVTGNIPTVYNIIQGSMNSIMGQMILISDNMKHVITQILYTHAIMEDGAITTGHKDDTIHVYYRSYNNGAPNLDVERGQWTKWKVLNHQYIDELNSRITDIEDKLKWGDSTAPSLFASIKCTVPSVATEYSVTAQDLGHHELVNAVDAVATTTEEGSVDNTVAPHQFRLWITFKDWSYIPKVVNPHVMITSNNPQCPVYSSDTVVKYMGTGVTNSIPILMETVIHAEEGKDLSGLDITVQLWGTFRIKDIAISPIV